jgi:hypothetical protein
MAHRLTTTAVNEKAVGVERTHGWLFLVTTGYFGQTHDALRTPVRNDRLQGIGVPPIQIETTGEL